MALTYGFYNSLNGDRRYSAKQFSSIFDGVITDGVYMGIGNRMMVKTANDGFKVNVQTGRAWFNHTWTLIDTIYVVELPLPEVLLDKYVAVCLQVDESNSSRRNSIVTVEGTPATNPQYPTLIDNDLVHQHPLAYCLVKAGASAITQAQIVNTVGTSACPFVTGAVQNMNIDDLVAQWQSQYTQWYNAHETEFTTFMTNSNNTFNTFMTQSGNTFITFMTESGSTFDDFMQNSDNEFSTFMQNSRNEYGTFIYDSETAWNAFMNRVELAFDDFVDDADARIDAMLDDLGSEFTSFWTTFRTNMTTWITQAESDWEDWFEHMQGQLSQDAATHLQDQIDAIKYFRVDQNRLILPNTAASVSGSTLILSTP